MKKDFRVYLDDIIESSDRIALYIHGKSKEEFMQSIDVQDAVTRRLEIIGEAVKRLPEELKDQHREIAWGKAIGMRNILIHAYDDVDFDVVWSTVREILPPFKKQVEELLRSLEE